MSTTSPQSTDRVDLVTPRDVRADAVRVRPAPQVAGPAPTSPTGGGPARPGLGYHRELDGLRGVAVIVVVVYHVGGVLWPAAKSWLLPGGMLGVDLFFVLSGFLITSLLLGENERRGRVDLPAFARRRLLRLVPGMVGLMAVTLVVAALTTDWLYEVDEVVSSTGWALTFTANWAMLAERPFVMGHLWSVAIEGQFYVLWAVAVVVALRFRRASAVLAAVALAGIAAVIWWRYVETERGTNMFHIYMGTLTRLDAPLVGTLAGLAVATGRLDRLRGRAAAAVALVGLAVVAVCVTTLGPFDPVLYRGLFTAVALAGACAVVGVVRAGGGALVWVLSSRPLVLAGMVSYSLYLWHLPIFDWLTHATPDWSPALRVPVGVVAAVAAATLSYVVIERPFLRRRHRTPA